MSKYDVDHNYHEAIRISNFTDNPIPLEVLSMLEELDDNLIGVVTDRTIQVTGSDSNGTDGLIEWSVGSPYEGGSSCIWSAYENDGVERWIYRNSWDGFDHPVVGGMQEVVANSISILMGC